MHRAPPRVPGRDQCTRGLAARRRGRDHASPSGQSICSPATARRSCSRPAPWCGSCRQRCPGRRPRGRPRPSLALPRHPVVAAQSDTLPHLLADVRVHDGKQHKGARPRRRQPRDRVGDVPLRALFARPVLRPREAGNANVAPRAAVALAAQAVGRVVRDQAALPRFFPVFSIFFSVFPIFPRFFLPPGPSSSRRARPS